MGMETDARGIHPRKEGSAIMGYFSKFSRKGIPFMEGREKGKLRDMTDRVLHIADFGFIDGDHGNFAVVLFAEDDARFYFANSIITEMLEEVERDGMREELAYQPIVLSMRKSQSGNEYMTFEFIAD